MGFPQNDAHGIPGKAGKDGENIIELAWKYEKPTNLRG